MIGLVGSVGPFRHLRRKDIQIAVAIDVTEIQSVTMDHVTPQQIAAHPGGRICRIALAIVKFERAAAVTRCDDDLPVLARFKLPSLNPPADAADLDRFELCSPLMFEPIIPCEEIHLTVAIHVRSSQSFSILGGILKAFACTARKNFLIRPGFSIFWIGGRVG